MADIRTLVRNTFNNTIATAPIHPELKRALAHSTQLRQAIQNVYAKLIEVEALRHKKGKKSLKKETIKAAVRDFAMVFIEGTNRECEKRIQSDLERIRLAAMKQKEQDLELASKGKYVGEFEELKNMTTTDERSM
jgi:hypothetical protein